MSQIRIEPYSINDAQLRYDAVYESKEHLLPFIIWAADYTLDKSELWIKDAIKNFDGVEYPFKIIDEFGEYVGEVRIIQVTVNKYERFANLAYWVRKEYVQRGIATQAIRLAANFAFKELGLYRLQIMVLPDNENSISVALKVGARREGQLYNQWNFEGKMHHPLLFSLIANDINLNT